MQNAKMSRVTLPDLTDLRGRWTFCQFCQAISPLAKSEEAAPRNRSDLEMRSSRLTTGSAFCVGGYDDNYNVANGGTDQSTDGAIHIMVSAHVRNDFAVAISSRCGEGDHGRIGTR